MSGVVRSMTGFARAMGSAGEVWIVVTVKSLNHRGLDLHFHTPPELDRFENALRTAIKRSVIRGHLDVRVTLGDPSREGTIGINSALLASYIAAFRKAAADFQISNAILDLNQALRLPGMFDPSAGAELNGNDVEPVLVETLERALCDLNEFRSREGAELANLIRRHNQEIQEASRDMEQIRIHALPFFQQRLTERLKELFRNSTIDTPRITQEAALIADRSDIGEEVSRLQIHSKQLAELLKSGGEVGKKLDFLLQEMNREANTILSKTNGIGEQGLKITDLALATKANIEKIREQALNLE